MATAQLSDFIQHLRTAMLLNDGASVTDAQLLARFVDHRDEAAFSALVRRHGPMVWGVCCRLLHPQDAEDAFQATFLVVVRRAASVIPREMVANWLYGVAHQTALKARARTAGDRLVPGTTRRYEWPGGIGHTWPKDDPKPTIPPKPK
jgi:DNA-directed RNA polymerase specialized sigma24 family protein